MIFIKNIFTNKRINIALILICFLVLFLLAVRIGQRSQPVEESEPKGRSCYSVTFDIASKGESFVDKTESVLVENISTGKLLVYFYHINDYHYHAVKMVEDKNFVRVNGVVTQEYKLPSPFFVSHDKNFVVKLETQFLPDKLGSEKILLSSNMLKQIAAFLTFPNQSISRKEFFGEVLYDFKNLNNPDGEVVVKKKNLKMPFNLDGLFKFIPLQRLEGSEKMILKDYLQSTVSSKLLWNKESLLDCEEIRGINLLKNINYKLLKTDLSYDFDLKAAHLANMKKRIYRKNLATFFQSIKLDEKGLLTNEDFLTLRAFIEIYRKESLSFLVGELKKMPTDSTLFQALLPVLAKPIVPEVQDFVVELSNHYLSLNEESIAQRIMQLLMQETNPNSNTIAFLRSQLSDTGLLIRGSVARSSSVEAPEQSQVLIDDLLKIHETYRKEGDARVSVVEDALGNAGASQLLHLVDVNTPEGLSNLRFIKDIKALEILMNTLMNAGEYEHSIVNKDSALSALEMRISFNIEDEESKKEIKTKLRKYFDNFEAKDAQEEILKRRVLSLLNPLPESTEP